MAWPPDATGPNKRRPASSGDRRPLPASGEDDTVLVPEPEDALVHKAKAKARSAPAATREAVANPPRDGSSSVRLEEARVPASLITREGA